MLRCLEESGITAFFTRSSAANIPVNLNLSKKLGISEELYTVSIPVGATVNMAGAAITITTLTLAAPNPLERSPRGGCQKLDPFRSAFVVLVVLNFLSEINDISVSLNFPWRSGAQGAKKSR